MVKNAGANCLDNCLINNIVTRSNISCDSQEIVDTVQAGWVGSTRPNYDSAEGYFIQFRAWAEAKDLVVMKGDDSHCYGVMTKETYQSLPQEI